MILWLARHPACARSDNRASVHLPALIVTIVLNELTGILKGIPADELARAKDDVALEFFGAIRGDRSYFESAAGA